jgi:hypothetical protein
MRAPIVSVSLSASLPALVVAAVLAACGGGAASTSATTPAGTNAAAFGDGGVSSLDIDAGVPTTVPPLDGMADGSGTKLPNVGATRGPEPGRTKEDVLAMVKSRKAQARACYDAALKDHPGMEGTVALKWTIDPKGNVTDVAVDSINSQFALPEVTNCLSTIVMSFHFPESVRGLETHASYPWTFHPRGTPAGGGTNP